jgi:hypothetical protein
MLILECSQGCYGRTDGRTEGLTVALLYPFATSLARIIKQQWKIEEISIFSNSSHLEWRAELWDTILKWDYPSFSFKFFFQPIYADDANYAYFDKRSHSNLLL